MKCGLIADFLVAGIIMCELMVGGYYVKKYFS